MTLVTLLTITVQIGDFKREVLFLQYVFLFQRTPSLKIFSSSCTEIFPDIVRWKDNTGSLGRKDMEMEIEMEEQMEREQVFKVFSHSTILLDQQVFKIEGITCDKCVRLITEVKLVSKKSSLSQYLNFRLFKTYQELGRY